VRTLRRNNAADETVETDPTAGLRSLQASFRAFLLHGDSDIGGHVIGTRRVDASTRLSIYYDAYRLRLGEALSVDYPVLKALLGEDAFAEMARAYTAAHPSRHFSIRWFGRSLAGFLRSAAPWRRQPRLAELAAFEWALGEVFDAPDAPVLRREDLAALPGEAWPTLRLRLHPALRRLELSHDVPALWNAVEHGGTAPPSEPAATPVSWVLWRKALRTYFRSLPPADACALDTLREGACFQDLCERLCAWMPADQVAQHAAALLQTWIDEHMVSAVTAP